MEGMSFSTADFFASLIRSNRIANINEREGKGIMEFFFFFKPRWKLFGMEREIFYWDIVKLFDRSNGSKNFSSNFEGMNVDEKCAVGNISGIRQIKWTKCEIRPCLFRSARWISKDFRKEGDKLGRTEFCVIQKQPSSSFDRFERFLEHIRTLSERFIDSFRRLKAKRLEIIPRGE